MQITSKVKPPMGLPLAAAITALLGCAMVSCKSAVARSAKRDASSIQKDANAADDAVSRAQRSNAALVQSNEQLSGQIAGIKEDAKAIKSNSERIEDKVVVLQQAKRKP